MTSLLHSPLAVSKQGECVSGAEDYCAGRGKREERFEREVSKKGGWSETEGKKKWVLIGRRIITGPDQCGALCRLSN